MTHAGWGGLGGSEVLPGSAMATPRPQVCTDTVEESALKVDWEKNPLLHQGIEPV